MRRLAKLQHLLRNERGAALLEFAIVLPLLAFLLVAMVDFGRGLAISNALKSAARSGAEYGSLFPQDTAGLQGAVSQALGSGITLAPGAISTVNQCRCSGVVSDCAAACNGGGTAMYLYVRVNYTYTPILSYPGIAANYPLNGTAEFRMR